MTVDPRGPNTPVELLETCRTTRVADHFLSLILLFQPRPNKILVEETGFRAPLPNFSDFGYQVRNIEQHDADVGRTMMLE